MKSDQAGVVFDIQRFSIHDGPGIRTAVFLKGCSLRCFWCHNPESVHPKPEIQFYAQRCDQCGECLTQCPAQACSQIDGQIVFDFQRCTVCGQCQDFCQTEALTVIGRSMSVDEVMAEVRQDRAFYDNSGGGVTLSGGEPVLQAAFSRAILARSHAEGIHTALETAGNYPWSLLQVLVLPYTDMVMMDIKHLDARKHRVATGVSNERILENARQLAKTEVPLLFRTPVVPTVNDSIDDLSNIAQFVRQLIDLRRNAAPIRYELLKFHKLAGDKYRSLGRNYAAATLEPLTADTMAGFEHAVQSILGDRLIAHSIN